MKFDLDQASIRLARASHLRLHDAAGSTVAVLWGSVWLTQEGDSRDYELQAGESLLVQAGGLTLVTAFTDSCVSVLEPSDAHLLSAAGRLTMVSVSRNAVDEPKQTKYLSAGELEHYVERARKLRARYIGFLFARLWAAARRALGRLRAGVSMRHTATVGSR